MNSEKESNDFPDHATNLHLFLSNFRTYLFKQLSSQSNEYGEDNKITYNQMCL